MSVLLSQQAPDRVGQDVRIYLQRGGWIVQASGDTGELWGREDAETPIAVPYRIPPGGVEWRSVTERLAQHERIDVIVVEKALQRLWVDVTRLRAAKVVIIAGSIPLSAGSALVGSAYAMIGPLRPRRRSSRATSAGTSPSAATRSQVRPGWLTRKRGRSSFRSSFR
jgi:hypothetical protein